MDMEKKMVRNSVVWWLLVSFLVMAVVVSVMACYFAYRQQQGELLAELDLQLLQVENEYRNLTENFWAIYLPVFEEQGDSAFLNSYFGEEDGLSPMEKLQLSEVLSHMAVRNEDVQWIAVYSPRRETNYIYFPVGSALLEIPEDFPYLREVAEKERRMEIYGEEEVRAGQQRSRGIAISGGIPGRAQGSSMIVGYDTGELERLCRGRGGLETLRFDIFLNGRTVYTSGEQGLFDAASESVESGIHWLDREKWYVQVKDENLRGAKVCYAVKWSEVARRAHGYTAGILGIILIMAGLAVGVYLLALRSLTREVNVIRKGLDILGENQLGHRIEERFHQPELAAIADSVNRMSESLQENIRRTREYEKRQVKSELQELQAKFNPHFLYNTLELFRTRCYESGDEETAELISQTASIFRGFIGSRTFIPMQEELAFSRRYLALFRARYGDSVRVLYDIDTQVLQYGIIRNVFQPIIENYFEHGYNPANEENYILFRGRLRDEETILFSIEDNGLGMEEGELRELNEQLQRPIVSEKESYGLRNLHQRLRLFYGGNCGLSLRPMEEGGLVIDMLIKRQVCDEKE